MTMARSLTLILAAITLGCTLPAGLDDRWAEPENIEFAASLNIDLSQMNRTASGLYWIDLETGTGPAVAIGHTVVVEYNVWLPDGTRVVSSHGTDLPREFRVHDGLVVAGIDEGVVGMQQGGRRKLVVRPELAFGRTGRGPVPPLTTLVYEIELVQTRP
jgi:FKBP-type peptidyl-prolyl cis-trans isomerase